MTGQFFILIHTVAKTRPAEWVESARRFDYLLTQVETRFNQIQSFNATVQIVASEGGSRRRNSLSSTPASAATSLQTAPPGPAPCPYTGISSTRHGQRR